MMHGLKRQRGLLLNPFRFGGGSPTPTLNLPFEEGDGATTVYDAGPAAQAFSAVGGAVVSNDWAAFGTCSLKLNGGSVCLMKQTGSDYTQSQYRFTGQFTMRMRVYLNSIPSNGYLVSKFDAAVNDPSGETEYGLGIISSTSIRLYYGSRGYTSVTHDFTVPTLGTGVEIDIELTRDASNVIRLFVDGVASATTFTDSAYIGNINKALCIGGLDYAPVNSIDGYVDRVQFFQTALHTSNFTPD